MGEEQQIPKQAPKETKDDQQEYVHGKSDFAGRFVKGEKDKNVKDTDPKQL